MRAIAFVQKLVAEERVPRGRYKDVKIHTVEAEREMRQLGYSSKLNVDGEFLRWLFELGRARAGAFLETDYDKVGVTSSTDIAGRFLQAPATPAARLPRLPSSSAGPQGAPQTPVTDQPHRVVGPAEGVQRPAQLLDRSKVRTQSRFSLSVRMKRSAQPLPSGARTKAGELSRPGKRGSVRVSARQPARERARHDSPRSSRRCC
jgi:hypothetical protein